ncbi:hypothetical protein [Paenibacillus medicaginis]|uniref:Uncharacterized protein n=1 Tax=Paenibacillus medicaginis TaxID=1470560 RepID=A0ABV5BUU1_9BACL
MNGRELVDLINKKPVVKFTEKVESEIECGFDDGMMARLVDFRDDGSGCFELKFDFSEFEQHNKRFEKINWYDKQGNPSLRWSETSFYPKNRIETFYIDYDTEINFLEIVTEERINDPEEIVALRWVVDQFEKVLCGEKAGNVEESLSFAHSVLNKYPQSK